MNKVNPRKVSDAFITILLWKDRNVGRIKPLNVLNKESGKIIDHSHDAMLNRSTTSLGKAPTKRSGDGDLSLGICAMTSIISFFVKGSPTPERS